MSSACNIFVVNPGSTSTKVAVARGEHIEKRETFRHPVEELHASPGIWEQYRFRLDCCRRWAEEHVVECSAVVTLGGLLRPVRGGVYRVNEPMLRDARNNLQGEHASNLGCALALDLARPYNAEAFIVDPVSVDEFEPLAYYSGHPAIRRKSLSHALNIHAVARRASAALGIPLQQSSFIVCHLGGGISIAPVRNGAIIDVNDAASDGPFSPERTGGLPLQQFISLFFSQQYTEPELRRFVMGNGGLVAYLNTNSILTVEKRIREGDTYAKEVLQAMAYQIAKEIGAMATVLNGTIDTIALTGGSARSELLTHWIEERVGFIAPVIVFSGDDEMQALASAGFRALTGQEQIQEY
ncbi:MAG: butyrate kinase [Bacteroidetes bacterium]|nr:MAG: butyrate kinase [Bacteroidota bacterium]